MSTNDKMQIHIVSSVKGGCGKTAFSLFKSLKVASEMRKRNLSNKRAEVLWIDADFRGTASRTLFYSKDEEQFKLMHSRNTIDKLEEKNPSLFDESPLFTQNILCYGKEFVPYTINDYLREDIQGLEKMIVHGYAYNEQKVGGGPAGDEADIKECINGMVDFIFSSGAAADKRLFNYGSGLLPTIEIGRFTYLMRTMLMRVCEKGKTKTKAAGEKNDRELNYKHIVIDMPPGDDAYSNALLETIRELAQKRKEDKDEIEIHLYVLTTSDRGHMDATLESVQDTCERLLRHKHEENIHIIQSEIRSGEFDPGNEFQNQIDEYLDKINRFRDTIHKRFPGENINIDLSVCKFQKEYYAFCRDIVRGGFTYSI